MAADTDGWVTTSSSAAAVTEPRRTTVKNATSCVTVTATRSGVKGGVGAGAHLALGARRLAAAIEAFARPYQVVED